MKKLTITLVLVVLSTALLVFGDKTSKIRLAFAQTQTSQRDNFTFEGRAQRALAMGITHVRTTTKIDGPDVPSIDFALATYSIFVVQPTYVQSFRLDDFHIETWYRLKVLETVSSNSPVPVCATCAAPSEVPNGVPTPAADEYLSSQAGGVIIVGGVTFEETTGLPFLNTSCRYVVFVSADPATKKATIVGGAFKLQANNDSLAPLDTGDRPSPIVTGVMSRFNNSLSQLRPAVN